MTNIIKKATDAYNTVLSSIEREKKIQKLTDQLGEKQTASQKAVVTKQLTELVQARKDCSCKIITKIFR